MSWRAFESAEPEMASFCRNELAKTGIMLIGTIRRDGSPRISCIEPFIVDDTLYLGMMWLSVKAVDLQRDPRTVLRNAICSSTGDEREISLRGRATEIRDPPMRARYLEAVAGKIDWREPRFHLFSVEIESAALIEYGRGEQSVRLWPQGTAFTRPYE
jgi:hypothetical protein